MQGRVTQVTEEVLASELSAPATAREAPPPAGHTTLSVEDLSAFDWNGGVGQILGGEFLVYTVVGAEDPASDEIALDDTPDPDGGTLSLLSPLAASYPEGTKVVPYPQVPERTAYVFSEDQEEEIGVRVPHRYVDVVPLGPRDEETAESIEYEQFEDEKVLTDVLGDRPVADSTFIDTDHGEQASAIGMDPLPGGYTPSGILTDSEVTIQPERDCLALVTWGVTIEFYSAGFTLNAQAWASLMLSEDGGTTFAPVGIERSCGTQGKYDASGPLPSDMNSVGGEAIVEMVAGQEYVLAIGARAAGVARVPAAKQNGISFGFFGA